MIVGAAVESPAIVTDLDEVAVMGQPIEQSGSHLGVAENRLCAPFNFSFLSILGSAD